VAARAHADGATKVRDLSELVTEELRVADVFVRARTSALNDEVVLDAMPGEVVVITLLREGENAGRHHRGDVAAKLDDERPSAALGRQGHAQSSVRAECEGGCVRWQLVALDGRLVVGFGTARSREQSATSVARRGVVFGDPTIERRARCRADIGSG